MVMSMSKIGETISCNLVALRAARGMTLQQVADRAGISKSHLFALEKSEKNVSPTIDMALALAKALGVSFGELTGVSVDAPTLHPEALRIATEIDALLRRNPA